MSDAPDLQRPIYDVDVAAAATECNPAPPVTSTFCVRAVIKCRCMEAPLCG